MHDAFARIQATLFFGILFGASAGFLWVIRDFIIPLAWAVVLAVLFTPLYEHLRRTFRGQSSLAAFATMTIAVLSVFVPLFLMAGIVAREGVTAYQTLATQDYAPYVDSVTTNPYLTQALAYVDLSLADVQKSVASFIQTTSTTLATEAFGAGLSVASFAAKALVMLYLLFFLLRDGTSIGAQVMRYLPLGDTKELFLFQRFSKTVRAIAKGSLVVALAQGATGALLLFLGGVPNPILWGVLMAFLSLIPAVGPGLVWVPAGVYALLTGNMVGAIIIFVGGLVVVSNIDNILRARLVGSDINMPDALILLSVLGGLGTFGVSGIIFGPVIAALALSLWQLFEEEYRDELIDRG